MHSSIVSAGASWRTSLAASALPCFAASCEDRCAARYACRCAARFVCQTTDYRASERNDGVLVLRLKVFANSIGFKSGIDGHDRWRFSKCMCSALFHHKHFYIWRFPQSFDTFNFSVLWSRTSPPFLRSSLPISWRTERACKQLRPLLQIRVVIEWACMMLTTFRRARAAILQNADDGALGWYVIGTVTIDDFDRDTFNLSDFFSPVCVAICWDFSMISLHSQPQAQPPRKYIYFLVFAANFASRVRHSWVEHQLI